MPTSTLVTSVSIGGTSISSRTSRTATGQISHSATVAAGKAGSMTDTSVATLSEGHGITTATVVDVYWDGGVRYACDTSVSTNAITLSNGAGDTLPAISTAVVLAPVVVLDTDFDGDKVEMIAVQSNKRAHMTLIDSLAAVVHATEIPAGELWSWVSEQGVTNPIAGDTIDEIHISNGDSDASASIKIGVLYESEEE